MKTGLERLIEQVDLAHQEAASVEALARSVRAALLEHIAIRGFALDCLERVLASPALADPGPVWRNPPIHANKELNYKFRVFFWSPGYVNWPHQHNTWSVTGVLHNQSSILVYAAADGPRGAHPKQHIRPPDWRVVGVRCDRGQDGDENSDRLRNHAHDLSPKPLFQLTDAASGP